MAEQFTVQVPASTSNLGSGFDVISAALDLLLTVEVEPTGGRRIEWISGWDGPPEENVLDRALKSAAKAMRASVPGARLRMRNPIPLQRGLGSSGAAIIAGVRVAAQLCQVPLSREQILEIAYPLEGHPDNLAASLLGGWALSWISGGQVRAESLPVALDCRFVLAVPESTVSTQQARAILPRHYSLQDAVFNLQRCALLVHALHAGRRDLLREAVEDRIHQPYRSRLIPGLPELLARKGLEKSLDERLLALSISGSGSAVVAIADGSWDAIGDWMVDRFREAGAKAASMVLDLDTTGVRVETRPSV